MKRINLLDPRLLHAATGQRAQRKRRLLQAAAAAAVGWAAVAGLQVRVLDGRIARDEQALGPLREQDRQIQELESQFTGLKTQIEEIGRNYEPITPAAVLAMLSQIAPEEMMLTSLSIEHSSPVVKIQPDPRGGRSLQPQPARFMHIRLGGMAKANVIITRLVARLTECGFRNVKLDDSREGTLNGQPCTLFQTSMDVSDTFITQAAPGGGVSP